MCEDDAEAVEDLGVVHVGESECEVEGACEDDAEAVEDVGVVHVAESECEVGGECEDDAEQSEDVVWSCGGVSVSGGCV